MTTTPRPWNSLTQVNTTDGGKFQGEGRIAGLPDGGYVVVWVDESGTYNPGGYAILGQRYDAAGNRAGGEVKISQFSDGSLVFRPAVTALANGHIAIAFSSDFSTYARIFDSSLNLVRQDNLFLGPPGQAGDPSITAFADGSYVASYTKGSGNTDIAARIVSAIGVVGSEFVIDNQADKQDLSELATLSNGNFVAVYRDQFAGSATDTDILYKIFTPAGTPVSTGIPVPAVPGAFGPGLETEPDVAALRDGGFVVVWTDPDGPAANDIRASILANDGSTVAADILVNTSTAGNQHSASVVALADGGFLATWDDASAFLQHAQRFDAFGHKIGAEFTVVSEGGGEGPQAALLLDGRIAFAFDYRAPGDLDLLDVATSIWTTGWSPVATGDFNGDGTKDFLWQDAIGNTSEWLMSPSGGIASLPSTPATPGWNVIASGDFNGDGTTDVMWQQPSTGATAEWLMAPTGGASLLGTPAAQGWNVIATGDFNGDGTTDLMWQQASTGATAEWLMASTGGVGSLLGTPAAQGWNVIASGDFNGDGTTDLMWEQAPSGATAEWLMSPAGGASLVGTPAAQGWNLLATGDFNGDQITDLFWQQASTGTTAEWLMASTGGANLLGTPAAQGWNLIASGDFNGDGTDDLMWKQASTGSTAEWLMAPTGGVGNLLGTPAAQGWNLLATGDFNGDHITDLFWQQASTGATAEWLMAPTGGANLIGTSLVQGWDVIGTGDFNGDATIDLMWQNALTGATAEWLMAPGGGVGAFVSLLTM